MSKIDVLTDDRGLQSCLVGANLSEGWIKEFLSVHKITTLDDFVYLVNSAEWERSLQALVEATSFKQDRIAGARFKSAYLAGQQALKQSLEVSPIADDPDQPLPESTTQQLNRDWDRKYSIKWESFVDPADSLRARVYREFKKFTMTLIECRKIKSILTYSMPKAHEEVHLQGGAKIAFDKEVVTDIKNVIDYYFALRTLAVAWSWGGNWTTKDRSGRDVPMMDLSTALGYADRALADCATYGRNCLTWLARNDLLTRGTMASLMRQQWSAGEALTESLRQHHVDWKSPAMQGIIPEVEVKRKSPEPSRYSGPDAKRARNLKADGLVTISMIKGGQKLCKHWNDARGCRQKQCPNLHQCDVKMPSGKPCLSKTHNRLQHSEATEWLSRPMVLQADAAVGDQQPTWQGDESQVRHSGQAPEISYPSARQVTMAGNSLADVASRLAAAKPVSWQGKGDIFQAPWVPILRRKWLVLDLWAGVSGLCLALLSMGCTFWALAAELDPQASAIAQANFPNLVHIDRVEHIDEPMLAPFFAKRKIRGVILGGGSPCQGNTVLNKDRRGLLDDRSWQPTEIARLKRLVQQIDPQIEVVTLLENVASMPDSVLSQYNKWMGFPPVKVSAGQCGWVQRNRFVWLGGAQGGVHTDLRPPADWEWKATEGSGIPMLTYVGKKPIPSKASLLQGFQTLFDPSQVVAQKGKGSIHPFTREFFHPEDRVPEVSPAAAQRFYEDHRRFPPASYEEQSLLWKGTDWRQLEPEERTQLMGWPIHFTAPRSHDAQRSPSVQNSVIGNGFHIPTILAVLCFIPQLLATKLPPPLQCMEEVAVVHRLEGTVWEPHRLKSFPDLLTAKEVTVGMKSCFPNLSIPHHVWDRVEERLQWCDLCSLQAFSAWQRMRGQEWKILGPIPMDAVARTQIYAGLSDQRYPGTSSRGLDHLLPPGLGPEAHILEGSLLCSPFSPTPWPEPDIAFVIHAICVWQHHLQSLSNTLRGVMRSVIKAVQPLQTALVPFRCFAAQQVSANKNAALMAALTILLRWPDVLQPQCLILGYPIVGAIPSSGVFRALCPGEDPDFTQWLGQAAVTAVDEICASRHHDLQKRSWKPHLLNKRKASVDPFVPEPLWTRSMAQDDGVLFRDFSMFSLVVSIESLTMPRRPCITITLAWWKPSPRSMLTSLRRFCSNCFKVWVFEIYRPSSTSSGLMPAWAQTTSLMLIVHFLFSQTIKACP